MLKLIAVELSDKCIMQPKCPFCYLKPCKEEMYSPTSPIYSVLKKRGGNVANTITICFEYNGCNLDFLRKMYAPDKPKFEYTMTTMPMVVTDTFAGFIASHKITAVALSYDEFKLSGNDRPAQWAKKARILKEHGLKVSCNYLLTDVGLRDLFMSFNNNEPSYISPILANADQINLLSLKPTGEYNDTDKEAIYASIESLKLTIPVAVDNCLGVQLGYTSKCHAGDEFVHIMADGTMKPCCFEDNCFLHGKTGETDNTEIIQC